jgi:hypothetical protein
LEEEVRGLRGALRSLADEARAEAGPHPAPERLSAYHYRLLPDDEAALLQNHLTGCRECAAWLLDLVAFCAPVEEPSRSSPAEIEAGWAALKARLGPMPDADRAPQVSRPPVPRPSLGRRLRELFLPASPRPYGYALAGLFAFGLLLAGWALISLNSKNRALLARLNERNDAAEQGDSEAQKALREAAGQLEEKQRRIDEERARADQLEARTALLEEQVAEERRRNRGSRPGNNQTATPRAIGEIVGLSLIGPRRSGDDDPQTRGSAAPHLLEVPAGGSTFTLFILVPVPESHYSRYAFEVTDPSGRQVLERNNLHRAPPGGLAIYLQGESLPPGQYRFKVYGVKHGVRTLMGDRLIEIRHKQSE